MSIEKTIEAIRASHKDLPVRSLTVSAGMPLTNASLHELADGYEALREALGHYADPMNWICCQPSYLHNCSEDKCWMTQYEGDGQGWDVAKAVLDKYKS